MTSPFDTVSFTAPRMAPRQLLPDSCSTVRSVQVLMSTYNGEQFVRAQVETIFKQIGVQVSCCVRDDGSTDNTAAILESLAGEHPRLETWAASENLGYENSFQELIAACDPGEFDYYAFSDQDDYWLPDKLTTAVSALAGLSGPACYASNLTVTDTDLQGERLLFGEANPVPKSVEELLLNGFAYGCTIVLNAAAVRLAQMVQVPQRHPYDNWLPILIALTGTVVWDQRSFIKYRQHGSNAVGASRSLLEQLRRWNLKRAEGVGPSDLARALLVSPAAELMAPESVRVLETMRDYTSHRLSLFVNPRVRRRTLKGTIRVKLGILLGRL